MAFNFQNLYNIYSGPSGFGLYIYSSSVDTRAAIASDLYFNNVDDTLNLNTNDLIFCLGTDGAVILAITSISNGAVFSAPINLDNNLALEKSAFGELEVAQLEPHVELRFNYGLNTRLYEDVSANSGTFTIGSGLASVQSGTNSSGLGAMHSLETLAYIPGLGGKVRFTAMFTTGVADSIQHAGIADADDGYGFGYDGVDFGVFRLKGGTYNWIPQTSWSEDKMDGTGPSGMTLDQTKLNVYQVQYQWLGAGQINFFLEDDDTGEFVRVHSIKYTNRNTTPSINNPTLPLSLHSENTGNTTNLTIKSSSMAAFTEGQFDNPGLITDVDVEGISYLTASGEVPILSIRSRTTYQSVTNRVVSQGVDIGVSADGTKPAIFRMYVNGALTGASFSDVNTNNSVLESDTSATAITGGTKILTIPVGKEDAKIIDLTVRKQDIHPGDLVTITVECDSNSTVGADITFRELF